VDPKHFLNFLNQVNTARPSMVIFQDIRHRLRKLISLDREEPGNLLGNNLSLINQYFEVAEKDLFSAIIADQDLSNI